MPHACFRVRCHVGYKLRGILQSQSRIAKFFKRGWLSICSCTCWPSERRVPMKYLSLIFLLVTAGCTAHPYTVCRGEEYCTPGLTHEEAIRASEIKKTWQDEKL